MEPTGLNRMLRRVSMMVTATLVAVLGVHGSALAQVSAAGAPTSTAASQPAPPAAAAPAGEATPAPPSGAEAPPAPPPTYGPGPGYGPTPGYGPPPGYPYRYQYGYHPGYYQAPNYTRPMVSTYRPFMLGFGVGMSSLSLSATDISAHEAGISYALHLGFGITPRWMILLAMDGAWAQFSAKDFNGATSFAQTTYTAGAQFFMMPWLYSRLGLGMACLEWSNDFGDWSDCQGEAVAAGVGAEFLQTHSTSLAAELATTVARYPEHASVNDRNDVWYSIGVNLIVNLY